MTNKLVERLVNELKFKESMTALCGKKITKNHYIECMSTFKKESSDSVRVRLFVDDSEGSRIYDLFVTSDFDKVKEFVRSVKNGTWEDFD